MNSIAEFSPFILSMMPQLLLCTATAEERLVVGTNVLCDKDQGITGPAAKDKAPSEQEFKDK